MTVEELQKILSTQPKDRKIVLAIDGEGNGYRRLADYDDECLWDPTYRELHNPDDFKSSDPPEDVHPVLVLYPSY